MLLRPLVQDTLFPTAGYVAGPNELGYLAQLRGVYEAFGVPMPLMYQRATATIVDSNVMRFLARHDLRLESLRPQDEGALNQLLEAQIPPAVAMSMDEAVRAVSERMETLARTVVPLDATLEGAARSAVGPHAGRPEEAPRKNRPGHEAQGRDGAPAIQKCPGAGISRRPPAGAGPWIRLLPE